MKTAGELNDFFEKRLIIILQKAIDGGFEAPIHVASVGANGSFVFTRYMEGIDHEGLDAEIIASNVEEGLFTFPINLMVVDKDGKAGGATIAGPDAAPVFHRN